MRTAKSGIIILLLLLALLVGVSCATASPTPTPTPTLLVTPTPSPTPTPTPSPTPTPDLTPAGTATIYFFDVGQGDATLLQGPDFTILVDAGRHDRNDGKNGEGR